MASNTYAHGYNITYCGYLFHVVGLKYKNTSSDWLKV